MITVLYTGLAGANGSAYNPTTSGGPYDTTKQQILMEGTLTLSANYGGAATHGDVLDFTSSATVANFGSGAPTRVEVYESPQAGVAALGYNYIYCPGPNTATIDGCTQQGGVLQILGTGAASGQGGTEITQGSAYSSFTPSLSGAVLRFRAWFNRL